MGNMVYNVNDTATQVLAAKQVKENIFAEVLHRNGKGVNEQTETNVSTLRMMKAKPFTDDARTLGATKNGGHFNANDAGFAEITEYDLNLLYIYDKGVDIPEVQQDMCPVNIMDNATKNIGGRVATEINASTIAHQLAAKYNLAQAAAAWTGLGVVMGTDDKAAYTAVLEASTLLDDGDGDNGIQAFPFDERQILLRPTFRQKLFTNGVLLGGSNYAQSMLAKGVVSPEAKKEFGSMYCGEIDGTPCYITPGVLFKRAGEWVGAATAFDATQAIVCAASATDRGISTQDYIKIIDSPNGAGKRLQPKTRWGINVCYPKGIVPILANGTAKPASALTVTSPGSK